MVLASIQQAESGGGGVGEFRYWERMSVTRMPTPTAMMPSGSSSSTHDHHFLQDGGTARSLRRKRGGLISSGVVAHIKVFRKSLKDLIGAGLKSVL